MCYYIIETRNGAMCIEGVFNADKAYQTFKSAGVWSTIPVIADEYALGFERNYSEIIADEIRARGEVK